jgi:hypothetical protein
MKTIISGVVQDLHGKPIAQAPVYFTNGPVPLPDIAALTDEEGAFTLTAPTRGSYTIACAAEGFAPTEVSIEIPYLEIQLMPQ